MRRAFAHRGVLAAVGCVTAAGFLLAVGGSLNRYRVDMFTTLFLLIAIAQAWNLLAGFSRQFSLGVSAFVGAGAYAAAMVSIHLGWSSALMVILGGAVAALLAAVLSVALLRLRDDYFTIGSLAAALAVQAFAMNSEKLGGSAGLNLPFTNLPSSERVFQYAVACVLLTSLATVWIMSSATGLRMSAVGQDENAAVTLGVNVRRLRFCALVLSSGLTGLAGAVLAIQQVNVEPIGSLSFTWTIGAVVMTLVGGVGTFFGPVLGTVAVYLGLTKQLSGHPVLGLVVEAVVLVVVVTTAPRGLWPLVVERARLISRRTASRPRSFNRGLDATNAD